MFYEGTKKRISVSKGAEKEAKPVAPRVKGAGKTYSDFKKKALEMCDTLLTKELKPEEREKVLWLRSRIEIEL